MTSDGTATAGEDYTAVTTIPGPIGVVEIPASTNSIEVLSNSFDITVLGDDLVESGETFEVAISVPTNANATLGAPTTATGTITDNDTPSETTPEMTISADVNYIADGGTITFTVDASHQPTTATDVMVMLDGASFIETGRALSEPVTLDGVATNTFTVVTRADSVTSGHGIITATIMSGTGYIRSSDSAENEASVAVVDNLPVISIGEITPIYKSVGQFTVTLTSDTSAIAGLPINIDTVTISSSSGPQYYTSHTPTEVAITDVSTNNSEEVMVTITADNSNFEGQGEITVSLTDGTANYTADPNANSRTVTIMDDQTPPVSVALDGPVSVVEGENIVVSLTATSTSSTQETIMVDLQASNDTGTYLNYTNSLITIVAAPNTSTTSDPINIPTSEVANSTEGAINLVVNSGTGYLTASTTPTSVKVLAKEELPEVTIARKDPAVTSVQEGEDVVFTITSSGVTLTNDLSVTVSFQGGADFILGTPETTVMIDQDTNTGDYTIMTEPDTVEETADTITVTISPDPKQADRTMDATYLVGSDNTSSIMIEDNDAMAGSPVITISANTSEVYEGHNAVFTITTASPPTGDDVINVHYRITQVGDFLGSFTAEDNVDITSTGSEEVSITTASDDDEETDGAVTVQLIADTEPTATYSVGTTYKATTNIRDDDDATLPTINIVRTKANITEGTDNAEFTIMSVPNSSSETTVQVDVRISQTGNFLRDPAGTRTPTITIGTDYPLIEMINDDQVAEVNGTITATLLLKDTPTYGIGAQRQAVINVSDDEGVPTITYDLSSFTADEGNPPAPGTTPTPTVLTLNVGLSHVTTDEVVVNYTFGDSTNTSEATRGDDYEIPSTDNGTLRFAPSSITPQPITINVTKDALFEINEEVTVNFSLPALASPVAQLPTLPSGDLDNKVKATITNDDAMPSVSIAGGSVTEGDVGESGTGFFHCDSISSSWCSSNSQLCNFGWNGDRW